MSDVMENMCNEVRKENALRMLANGKLSLEEIAEFSGLSLEEVKKLQKDTNA